MQKGPLKWVHSKHPWVKQTLCFYKWVSRQYLAFVPFALWCQAKMEKMKLHAASRQEGHQTRWVVPMVTVPWFPNKRPRPQRNPWDGWHWWIVPLARILGYFGLATSPTKAFSQFCRCSMWDLVWVLVCFFVSEQLDANAEWLDSCTCCNFEFSRKPWSLWVTFAFFQLFPWETTMSRQLTSPFPPSILKNLGERLYLPSNLFAAEEDPPPQVLVKASFFFQEKFLSKGIKCFLNSFGHHFEAQQRRLWWLFFGYFEAKSLATYCYHDGTSFLWWHFIGYYRLCERSNINNF